jgi:hypothetical protein
MPSAAEWRPIFDVHRVFCPRTSDEVDLSSCIGCGWLIDLDRSGGTARIRCDLEDVDGWPADLVWRDDHID